MKEGKCSCETRNHKPNSLGQCFECEIEGCASCLAEDSEKCYFCIDDKAINQEGICICETGYKFN